MLLVHGYGGHMKSAHECLVHFVPHILLIFATICILFINVLNIEDAGSSQATVVFISQIVIFIILKLPYLRHYRALWCMQYGINIVEAAGYCILRTP